MISSIIFNSSFHHIMYGARGADFHCNSDDAKELVKAAHDACYSHQSGADPPSSSSSSSKWRSAVDVVKTILRYARERAIACSDPGGGATPGSPWTTPSTAPKAFGVKNADFLPHVPTLRVAASEMGLTRLTYVHVVRDGRDHMASGGNSHTAKDWSALGFGGGSEGVDGVATWVASNLAVKTCCESLARESSGGGGGGGVKIDYVLIRTEDLATEDKALRRSSVTRILEALDLPRDTSDVDRGTAVFDVPIDAPDDFLQSHYGRWRTLSHEDQTRWFDTVKPGLDALGYRYDPNDNSMH